MKHDETFDELTQDEVIALALATSPTITAAAEAAGVSRATIYRRYNDDLFFPSLVKQYRDLVQEARISRAAEIADSATAALLAVLDSEDATTGERIRAASALLSTYGQR